MFRKIAKSTLLHTIGPLRAILDNQSFKPAIKTLLTKPIPPHLVQTHTQKTAWKFPAVAIPTSSPFSPAHQWQQGWKILTQERQSRFPNPLRLTMSPAGPPLPEKPSPLAPKTPDADSNHSSSNDSTLPTPNPEAPPIAPVEKRAPDDTTTNEPINDDPQEPKSSELKKPQIDPLPSASPPEADIPAPPVVQTTPEVPLEIKPNVARKPFKDIVTIGSMKYKIEVSLPEDTSNDELASFIQIFRDQILQKIVQDPNFRSNGPFAVSLQDNSFSVTDQKTQQTMQTFGIPEGDQPTIETIRTILNDSTESIHVKQCWSRLGSLIKPTPTTSLSITSAGAPFKLRGIPNQSNNCWINATLQLLLSSKAFRDWISSEEANKDQRLYQLRKFYNDYIDDRATLDSQCVREMIPQLLETISRNASRQEDAAEALGPILYLLPDNQKAKIKSVFTYETVTGSSNDLSSNKTEISIILHLAIPQTGDFSLQTMASSYFSETHSQTCSSIEPTEVQGQKYKLKQTDRSYVTAPSELWIQIVRFRGEGATRVKDGRDIKIEDQIDIPLANGSKATYKLTGHINHLGERGNSGHYEAYVSADDKLYCCNDKNVSEVTAADKQSARSQAYLVRYELVSSTT